MKVKTARYVPEPDYFNQVHYRYLNKISSVINCVQKSIGFVDGVYPCVIVCGLTEHSDGIIDFISKNKPEVLILVGETDPEKQRILQSMGIFRVFKVKNERALSLFFIMHGKFLSACSLVLCGDDEYRDVSEYIRSRLHLNYNTLGFFDDIMFGLNHGIKNLSRKFINGIEKCDNCIVVGHGPSLINDIEVLKNSTAPIISCGSSIDSLYQNNIVPDYEVLLERTPNMEQVLKNLPDEYLNKITLISTELLAPMPKVQAFKEVLLFTKADELMRSFINVESISMINPLVGNFGLRFGQKIAKNVYLFGMDNGSKTFQGHCESSKFYANDKSSFNLRVPANFGGYINTNWLYKLSITQMENALDPEVKVYNCSDGSLIKGTIPLKVTKVNGSKPKIFSKNIEAIESIKKEIVSKLRHCRTTHYSLQKDLEMLKNPERKDIIRRLIIISEKVYENYFDRKVLNGLQSFFIEIVSSMFTVPLQNDNLELAKFCIENTIEFLKECTSLLQKYQKLEFREY